jgi:hypothetical protein
VRAAPTWLLGLAIVGVGGLVAAGCASGGGAPGAAGRDVAAVAERDFRIVAPTRLPAGDERFVVHNRGPVAHEFIVIRMGRRPLPMRADGLTVDEEALEARGDIVGALEPGQAGSVRDLAVRLAPGRYELICNMSGHFLGGMHVQLVVR